MDSKALLFPFLALCAVPAGAAPGQEHINFVIVLGDDCSYIDLGCYGSPNSLTPNIDALARNGITFNHCYQAMAISGPTRNNLYTGMYPVRNGAYIQSGVTYDHVKSFSDYLIPGGYKTALYGKEHVDRDKMGYEYLGAYADGNMDYSAIEAYLASNWNNPFLLIIASHEPHQPWNCGDPTQWDPETVQMPEIYADNPTMRKYYIDYLAEVNMLDYEVGQVRRMVREHGLESNTVFIFLSEHGNCFPFAKWTNYNLGLHSGCIVSWPGVTSPGRRTDAIVEYSDFLPTLLDIAGIPFSPDSFDGQSFKEVLTGAKDIHKKYTYGIETTNGINGGNECYPIRSIGTTQYRYIVNLMPDQAYRNNSLRLPFFQSWRDQAESDPYVAYLIEKVQYKPAEELYDLTRDPYCQHNLAGNRAYTDIVRELREELFKWMESQHDMGIETEKGARERLPKYFKTGMETGPGIRQDAPIAMP